MGNLPRFVAIALAVGSAALLSTGCRARADATVRLSGADSDQGLIDLTTAPQSQYGGLITQDGVSGYSLWGLLAGSTSATTTTNGSGTITANGGIITTTPVGDNSKNAILRDYVVVTDGGGHQSVVSLGEIDPMFSGTTSSNSDLITFSGSTASLTFLGSGAAGRDLADVTSIQLVAAPALPGPITPAPPSDTVTLSGLVGDPGSYDLSRLQNDFTPVTEIVNGDTYAGVPLWTFLDPSDSDILDQYVVTAGTDGYEVVLSLAELDPSLGGNPSDLLPYADTGGNFPADGVARTLLPSDTPFAHGRWESDLDLVDVEAVPEPGSLGLLLSGLTMLVVGCRNRGGRRRL